MDKNKKLTRRSLLRSVATGVAAAGAVGIAASTHLPAEDEVEINDLSAGLLPKVTVCHKPGTPAEQTKEVSAPAAVAHLAHGDTLGPCPPVVRAG